MGTVRPSARVRLQVRLDEGADTSALTLDMQRGALLHEPAPLDLSDASISDVTTALAQNQNERTTVERAADLIPGTERADRLARLATQRTTLQTKLNDIQGGKAQQRPAGLVVGPSDDLVVLGSFMPRKVKIVRNSIREADTLDVELDWRDCPFAPEMVRALFIDVAAGTVSADEFAAGVDGGGDEDGPYSVIRAPRGSELVFKSATRFVGFAEEIDVDFRDGGNSVVLRCRDLTQMLVTRHVPDGHGIDLTVEIVQGIQQLIDSFEALRGMYVYYGTPNPDGTGGSDLGPIPAQLTPKALWTRRGKQLKHKRQGQPQITLWDHITDVCVGLGLVPMVRGFHLFLVEPRTFFAGRSNPVRMAYGSNLTSWRKGRKLVREKVPTVQVRCYDPTVGRSRWGQYPVAPGAKASGVFGIDQPPRPNRANEVAPGGKAEETISVFTVAGISDGVTMANAARSIFEQVGRREIEGTVETSEITSLPPIDPGADDPEPGDLLNLQSGDALEVTVAPLNDVTTGDATNRTPGGAYNSVQDFQSMSTGKRTQYLSALGYTVEAAARIAQAYARIELLRVFRVVTNTIDWDAKVGFQLSIGFQNFLVIREISEAGKQSETPLVSAVTGGSNSAASKAWRAASAAGVTAGAQAVNGELTPEQYAAQSSAAAQDASIASRARNKGG